MYGIIDLQGYLRFFIFLESIAQENSMNFRRMLTTNRTLKIYIITSLCCYVAMLGLIALTHEHCHDQCADRAEEASNDTCMACSIATNTFGTSERLSFAAPFRPSSAITDYEPIFLLRNVTVRTYSRAPPIVSMNDTSLSSV